MQELTTDNLNEIINNNKKVIVQYGAAWCGACRIIKPKFQALEEDNQAFHFSKLIYRIKLSPNRIKVFK